MVWQPVGIFSAHGACHVATHSSCDRRLAPLLCQDDWLAGLDPRQESDHYPERITTGCDRSTCLYKTETSIDSMGCIIDWPGSLGGRRKLPAWGRPLIVWDSFVTEVPVSSLDRLARGTGTLVVKAEAGRVVNLSACCIRRCEFGRGSRALETRHQTDMSPCGAMGVGVAPSKHDHGKQKSLSCVSTWTKGSR
jgi:hypothetical protein